MATFKYTAVSDSGQKIDGVIKSSDQNAAIIELKRNVQSVISIKEIEETPELINDIFKKKISDKSLALVCRQFSIILKAGLPIVKSVRLVGEQTEDKDLKKLLIDVSEDVKGGMSMADSFEQRRKDLPTTFIETVRAGEASGRLDTSFERLSSYFNKKQTTHSKVVSALMYPAFVLVLAVIVIGVLMIFAVPKFTEAFSSFDVELPLPTRMIIAVSNFFRKWTWLIILIIFAIYSIYLFYRSTEDGHYKTDKFKLQIPLLGRVRLMSAASEFATTLSTMLAAGLPAVKALNITGRSISNYAIGRDILKSCTMVEGGYRIVDSLKKETELPNLLLEVTGVGEEAGSMEETLSSISEFYDNEVETATTRAVNMLEPAIILGLAVIVVFIMLAVYMPMLTLYGSI